jgi:hypothetical protein
MVGVRGFIILFGIETFATWISHPTSGSDIGPVVFVVITAARYRPPDSLAEI